MSHTKGPWTWDGKFVVAPIREDPRIAYVYEAFTDCPPEECDANAKLIAAAPELLEALKAAKNTVECASIDVRTGEELPWYRMAKKAIAKAEGGQ